jgi:hypothetical protein
VSQRRACKRRTWSPPRGRRGNPMDRLQEARSIRRRRQPLTRPDRLPGREKYRREAVEFGPERILAAGRRIELRGDRRGNARLGRSPVLRNVQVPGQGTADGWVVPNCQSGQIAHGTCSRFMAVAGESRSATAAVGGLLRSSVFAISPHPVFAHIVLAQDLTGLLCKAPVSARLRLVAVLRRLRPMRMRALFGRLLPSGQSGRPSFMRRSRLDCRWQDRDRGPPAPD